MSWRWRGRPATAPPPPQPPRAPDLLLDGLAAHYNDGYAAGVPMLRAALAAFGAGMPAEDELRWLWLACVAAAIRLWDDDRWARCPPGTSSSPARPGRSASFRSP